MVAGEGQLLRLGQLYVVKEDHANESCGISEPPSPLRVAAGLTDWLVIHSPHQLNNRLIFVAMRAILSHIHIPDDLDGVGDLQLGYLICGSLTHFNVARFVSEGPIVIDHFLLQVGLCHFGIFFL